MDITEVVCIQPLASHPIFNAVYKLENTLDNNNQKGISIVMNDIDSLNSIKSLFLVQIIEALESSACLTEDVFDVMKIIGLKYQISPLII